MNPKHEKTTEVIALDDGVIEIREKSWYEELSFEKVLHQKEISTSTETLLRDVVTCLEHITKDKTRDLVLLIKSNEYGVPKKIVKKWTTLQKQYGKRSTSSSKMV